MSSVRGGSAPARGAVKSLRKAAWSRMDPVEKWTTLIDIGRCATTFLWSPTASSGHRGRLAKGWTAAVARIVPSVGDSWLASLPSSDGSCVPGNSGALRSTATLPYAVRLRIVFSLLMWTRCLRDVQDTIARLHLPYARTTRLAARRVTTSGGGDLAAHVFPTRLSERLVDPFSAVEVYISGAVNETGLQIPAPHTWDPETSVTVEDTDAEATFSVASDRAALQGAFNPLRGSREGKLDRARRVAGLNLRPSADDHKVAAAAASSPRRRRPPVGHVSPSSAAAAAEPFEATWSNVLDPAPTDDAQFHRNVGRAEGCPLNAAGELDVCPVRVWAAASTCDVSRAMSAYVHAHGSILSSLYIQGRVVDFATDVPEIAAYIRVVFAPLLEGGFLSVTAVDGTTSNAQRLDGGGDNDGPGSEQPRSATNKEPAYLPEWALRHAWVVPADSGLCLVATGGATAAGGGSDMAHVLDTLLRHGPSGIVLVPTPAEQGALTAALAERCAALTQPGGSNNARSRWTVSVLDEKTADGTDVPTMLSAFSMVSLLTRAPRRATTEWVQRCLPPQTRMVGVNAHAADLLWFYPHAMVLPLKVGNAFRYRGVARSVLWRSWPQQLGLPVLSSMGWRRSFGLSVHSSSGLPFADLVRAQRQWRPSAVEGGLPGDATSRRMLDDDESAEGALLLERSVEFLARPSKWTFLSLLSAKMLRL